MGENEDSIGQVDLRVIVGVSPYEADHLLLERNAFSLEDFEWLAARSCEDHVLEPRFGAGDLSEGDHQQHTIGVRDAVALHGEPEDPGLAEENVEAGLLGKSSGDPGDREDGDVKLEAPYRLG